MLNKKKRLALGVNRDSIEQVQNEDRTARIHEVMKELQRLLNTSDYHCAVVTKEVRVLVPEKGAD